MNVHSTDDLILKTIAKSLTILVTFEFSFQIVISYIYMCTSGRKSGKGCYVYEAKSKEKKVNSGAEEILKSFKLTAPPAV